MAARVTTQSAQHGNKTVTTTTTKYVPMDDFRTPLYGCFSNIRFCCVTAFVPCFTGGQVKAMSDERDFHLCDCCCWSPQVEYYTRQTLRRKYGLDWNEIGDAVLTLFCTQCMICQHHAEMEAKPLREHC